MVAVEIILEMKMVFVGPFDSQSQALHWIGELVEANPMEKAFIAINETSKNRIRVYFGERENETSEVYWPAFGAGPV